jgi:hypothetical protein
MNGLLVIRPVLLWNVRFGESLNIAVLRNWGPAEQKRKGETKKKKSVDTYCCFSHNNKKVIK